MKRVLVMSTLLAGLIALPVVYAQEAVAPSGGYSIETCMLRKSSSTYSASKVRFNPSTRAVLRLVMNIYAA